MKEGNTQTNKKRPTWKTVLMWIIFPVGLFYSFLGFVYKQYRSDITTKTAVITTVVFAVFMLTFTVVMILIATLAPSGVAVRITVTSILLALGFTAAFAASCTLTARTMLSPLKGMLERIDKITVEDMSARLDPVESQDELNELSIRINRMLDGIQEAFDRQSNFISDASHELRTPISVIRGYSDLLARWGKTDESVLTESIEAIRAEAANMKSIVEQLLYLAKLGSFQSRPTEFELSEVVKDIVSAYDMTSVDKTIKYKAQKGIIDNGVGISEDDLPHIFDRFYRCDKARGRTEGSTGLGLAIAKSIAEMMGGNITAKSVLGKGSKFTITFPLISEKCRQDGKANEH